MKKWLGISVVLMGLLGLAACSKKKNVNPGVSGIPGVVNNCPVGSLVTQQGQVISQGNCPNGQGLLNNQCVPATPCNSIVNPLGGAAYQEMIGVENRSVLENLMSEIFGLCLKDMAFGSAACTSHSNDLSIFIDQGPTGSPYNNNIVWVTLYAGYEPKIMTFQMGYWPINNNQGFELRTNVPFRVIADQGLLGQDKIQLRLLYNNGQFARGFVSRVR